MSINPVATSIVKTPPKIIVSEAKPNTITFLKASGDRFFDKSWSKLNNTKNATIPIGASPSKSVMNLPPVLGTIIIKIVLIETVVI